MKVHDLKTDPEVFAMSFRGDKPFEIRFNDRDFACGDLLVLRETKFSAWGMREGAPLEYTGRVLSRIVTSVIPGDMYGIKEGWVVMGVRNT